MTDMIHISPLIHHLSNGLEILLLPDPSLPLVTYFTFYKVGSRNERPGITGISHLFEHLMFKGSRNFPEGVFDEIITAHGGSSNAYTSRDMTVYHEVFPSRLLEKIIEMEADRMAGLNITEESLESERQVVIEERLLTTDNSVEGFLLEQLYANAYIAHPYRWPIIGWMSDLKAITLNQCLEYHKIYYAPSNAMVVIGGAFDPDQTLKWLEQYYGSIPAQVTPPPVITSEPPQAGEKRIFLKKNAQHPVCAIGYHAISASHPDLYALDLFQLIFVVGKSSRLYRRLVEEEKLVTSVSGYFDYELDPSLFVLWMDMKDVKDLEKILAVIDQELQNLFEGSLSFREIRKARNILLTDFYEEFETLENRVHEIGRSSILFGDPLQVMKFPEIYETIKKQDIIRIARQIFTPDNRTVALIVPDKESPERTEH